MKKKICYISILIFLSSCSSGALSLKKENSDEFLVEKKNPLVMPPNYGELPKPGGEQIKKIDEQQEKSLKKILDNKKNISTTSKQNTKKTSIEKSILEKIE